MISIIYLRSSDNEIFNVAAKAALQSKYVERHLNKKRPNDSIQMPNIKSSVLKNIVEWLTYHKDDLPNAQNNAEKKTDDVCQWDKIFFSTMLDCTMLFEIIVAANKLEIGALVNVASKIAKALAMRRRHVRAKMASTIKFKSSDNKVFSMHIKAAQLSVTFKTMLEELGYTEKDQQEAIPLPNIKGSTLKKVIEWCTHHKDDPPFDEQKVKSVKPNDENKPECQANLRKRKRIADLSEWDQQFFKVEHSMLLDIIKVADYLDIPGLLLTGSLVLANEIKGDTLEEVCKSNDVDGVSKKSEDVAVAASGSKKIKVKDDPSKKADSSADNDIYLKSIIHLRSSDGQLFDVVVKATLQSKYIKERLKKDQLDEPMKMPSIKGSVLKKIIDWLTHHMDDPPYEDEYHRVNKYYDKKPDYFCSWDKEFFKNGIMLLEIIVAADKLGIKAIVDVGSRTACNSIENDDSTDGKDSGTDDAESNQHWHRLSDNESKMEF